MRWRRQSRKSRAARCHLPRPLSWVSAPRMVVIVDGAIEGDRVRSLFPGIFEQLGENGALNTKAIAETYWQLHLQHPSAWTQELDVRPFKEKF
jgi:hypothetical protein